MRPRLYEKIASDLQETILADASFELPRIVDLATQHGVSYLTMWKAIQVLVKKRLVVCTQGRKIAVAPGVRGDAGLPPVPSTATDKLFRELRASILDGTYLSGRPFPKVRYFLMSHGVSYNTLARVFARLSAEGLAHKRGNRWVVGPAPARTSPVSAASLRQQRPVVMIVAERPYVWSWFVNSSFTGPFAGSCIAETRSQAMRISMALLRQEDQTQPSPPEETELLLPAGTQQTVDSAKDLNQWYQGALIQSVHPDLAQEVKRLIPRLCRLKRPVVYFDSTDLYGDSLTRKALGVSRNFFRMHLDERAGVKLAVETLVAMGHRVIGVHGEETADWCRKRTGLIRQCARELDPAPRIVSAGPAEPLWNFGSEAAMHALVTRTAREMGSSPAELRNASPRTRAGFRGLLLKNGNSLAAMVRDHRPTALVALNDQTAREYYFFFRALGIEVPRHLSIVSFDNAQPSLFLPVSSIDFGFSRLGYLAAHVFVGDIPVRADRNGNIAGICTIDDRGSIGKPGDARELARLLKP